jgi:hypothetical protein
MGYKDGFVTVLRPRRTATSQIVIVIAPEPAMASDSPAQRAERTPRPSTTRHGFAGGPQF